LPVTKSRAWSASGRGWWVLSKCSSRASMPCRRSWVDPIEVSRTGRPGWSSWFSSAGLAGLNWTESPSGSKPVGLPAWVRPTRWKVPWIRMNGIIPPSAAVPARYLSRTGRRSPADTLVWHQLGGLTDPGSGRVAPAAAATASRGRRTPTRPGSGMPLDRNAFGSHYLDRSHLHLGRPSSTARSIARGSVSNSAMRRLAVDSSALSPLVRPGTRPR
jgi:hypothetical protein